MSDLPAWEVLSGTKTVSAQTHRLSHIFIASGAIIDVVLRSNQWLILHVEGRVEIEGTLSFRGFEYGNDLVTANAPDGTALDHKFSVRRGGRGGSGSNSGHFRGGAGAVGGFGYGGGGGGGAGAARQGGGNGFAAVDSQGGLGFFSNATGGDGGENTNLLNNGGLIYISATDRVVFNGGTIDLRGSVGANGSDGRGYAQPGLGSGGGGGGSPGGEGGVLLIRSPELESEPLFQFNGGDGGAAGRAGVRGWGTDGQVGPQGGSGYFRHLE